MGKGAFEWAAERLALMVAYRVFPHPKFLDDIARIDAEHAKTCIFTRGAPHAGLHALPHGASIEQAAAPTANSLAPAIRHAAGTPCWICGGRKDGHGH